MLDEASALLRDRLQRGASCTLADLAYAFPLPKASWVRLPSGCVQRVGEHATEMEFGDEGLEVSPTGRLAPGSGGAVGRVPRERLEEVRVWSAVWHAHSRADEEQEERRVARGGRGRAVEELVYGGLVAEPALLQGGGGRVMGSVDAGQWALTYTRTDRVRPAVPFVGADVAHLYGMQLSCAHVVPCTRLLVEGHMGPHGLESDGWSPVIAGTAAHHS